MKGPQGFKSLVETYNQKIIDEKESQDEQYALDKFALQETNISSFIESIEEQEQDERALDKIINDWIGQALLVKKFHVNRQSDIFELETGRNTLIPNNPWLMEIESYMDGNNYTVNRRVSSLNKNVSLLRPGNPLLDVIERYTVWDDRGTCFFTYREVPGWQDPEMYFVTTVSVEPAIRLNDYLKPSKEELVLIRRVNEYFQNNEKTFYLNGSGEEVTKDAIINFLSVGLGKTRKSEIPILETSP